ncbi:MAG: hypothetical protein Q9219_005772 [cf. Caloplaca sp. 3 TL-2023]
MALGDLFADSVFNARKPFVWLGRDTAFHPIPGGPSESVSTPKKYVHGKCTLTIAFIHDVPYWYRKPGDLRSDADLAVVSYTDMYAGAQTVMGKCMTKSPQRVGWYAPRK